MLSFVAIPSVSLVLPEHTNRNVSLSRESQPEIAPQLGTFKTDFPDYRRGEVRGAKFHTHENIPSRGSGAVQKGGGGYENPAAGGFKIYNPPPPLPQNCLPSGHRGKEVGGGWGPKEFLPGSRENKKKKGLRFARFVF